MSCDVVILLLLFIKILIYFAILFNIGKVVYSVLFVIQCSNKSGKAQPIRTKFGIHGHVKR